MLALVSIQRTSRGSKTTPLYERIQISEILERKGGWELIGNASQRAVVATVIDGKIYYVSCDVGAATRTGPVLVLMGSELRFEDRDGSIERQVHLT